MKPLHRALVVVLLVLVAVAGTTLVAQKVKPPAPVPQKPFALAPGLNVVTIWSGSTLHAFNADGIPLVEQWAETQTDLRPYMALANVDGGTDTELVMPGACQGADGTVYAWLAAYKQGKTGPWYSGKCDAAQRVPASTGDIELAGHDLERDGRDEVVLKTADELIVFRLLDDGKWSPGAPAPVKQAFLESDIFGLTAGEKAALAGVTIKAHGLAVGDVDGDNAPEIITVVQHLWTPPGATTNAWRSYLLVFDLVLDDSLVLRAGTELNAHAERDDFGLSVGQQHLCLADSDRDGIREIWLDGWDGDWQASRWEHQILSFRLEAGEVVPDKKWYLGWTQSSVRPYMTAGHVVDVGDGMTRDQIVLSPLDSLDRVLRVYDPLDEPSGAMPLPLATLQRPVWGSAKVLDGRLVLSGTLLEDKRLKLKKGPFIETLEYSGGAWVTKGYYEKRDGTEGNSLFVLGYGIREQ